MVECSHLGIQRSGAFFFFSDALIEPYDCTYQHDLALCANRFRGSGFLLSSAGSESVLNLPRQSPKGKISVWLLPALPTLKIYFQPKLNDSRISCGRDRSKTRRTKHHIWRAERWRIGHVEEFCSKFNIASFIDIRALDHCYVEVSITWAAYRITRTRSNRELGRNRECRRVEKARRRVLCRR